MEVLKLNDDLWEVCVHLLHENVDVGLFGKELARFGEIDLRGAPLRRRRSFGVVGDRRRVGQREASRCRFRDPKRWAKSKKLVRLEFDE